MQTLSTALDKAANFVSATIQQVKELSKPQIKFFVWLFERWLMLPVRYNFLNLSRYGGYSERTVREQFSKNLPFVTLFHALFAPLQKKECIAIFDPSFVSKSGRQTYGLGKWWSGTAQQLKKGLEVGCLAIADVADGTAYSLEVVQTPAVIAATAGQDKDKEKESLVQHYARVITERAGDIKQYTQVIAVDGYFMKHSFISAITATGLTVVTKARQDADMRYLYKGAQNKGKGRKKVYDGKVDWKSIDKRRWRKCSEQETWIAYQTVLYSVVLKQQVKVVYVEQKESGSYELLISTDVEMAAEKVLQYYRLRFGIELLIRDAKGHAGLEHCQGRSEEKLYNHFNMAMMSVSVAKYQTWAKRKDKEEVPFSMRSIKIWCMNRYMTDAIFSNLALDTTCRKIKRLYDKCLNIGSMAA